MKISKETLNILQNFSLVNNSLFIDGRNPNKLGTLIRTKEVNEAIYAEVFVPEVFENQVSIYNLDKFLKVILSMDSPEVEITDDYVTLTKDKSSLKFACCDPDNIVYPDPNKTFDAGDLIIDFEVSKEDLNKLLSTSAALSLDMIRIYSRDSKVYMMALDSKFESNTFEVCLGDGDFKTAHIKRSMITIPQGNYRLKLYDDFLIFENQDITSLFYAIVFNEEETK